MTQHLIAALKAIDEGKCEKSTRGSYVCIEDTYTSPLAKYLADRWCNSCIAQYALRGNDVRDFRPARYVETANAPDNEIERAACQPRRIGS